MQTTSSLHDQMIELLAHVAKNVMHNPIDLDPTETMLNADALAGNGGIDLPFVIGQAASFGFLLGLVSVYSIRFIALWARTPTWIAESVGIALKAGILPQMATGWKSQALFVSQLLVMAFAFDGGTDGLDFARAFVTNHVVLDPGTGIDPILPCVR